MENQFKKITWVIKNFPSLQSEKIYSDNFLVGGCKWNILAYPKGKYAVNYLSLFLQVANHESLPTEWRRYAKVCFVLVNQRSEILSLRRELEHWFDQKAPRCHSMFPHSEIHAKESGFLVNGELRVVAEIDVLEVIGKLDVSEETSTIVETMEVHGFQLLPSQAKVVSRMFERHPQIASDFRPKDPILKTCYMSLLLGLIEIMCKLPQEMSKDDLSDAYVALGSLRDAGFKLDWLEKKLDEMSKKQENLEANETVLQEMEEELKDLKQKSSILEAEMQAIETLVSIAKAPFSFDDVV